MEMRSRVVAALLGAFAVTGCAAPMPSGPLGYGTPGVSQFMPDAGSDSLSTELARCRAPSSADMAASCAQLHTTMRNQPGNTMERP